MIRPFLTRCVRLAALVCLVVAGGGGGRAHAATTLESFEGPKSSWAVSSDTSGAGSVEQSALRSVTGVSSARVATSGSSDRAQVRATFSDAASSHVWGERPGTWFWQHTKVYVPAATVAQLGAGQYLTIAGVWPSNPGNSGWFIRVRQGGALSVVGSRDWDNAAIEFPVYGTLPLDRWFSLETGLHSQAGPGVKRAFAFVVDGAFYGWYHQGRMQTETYDRAAVGVLDTNASGSLEMFVDDWSVPGTSNLPVGPDARPTASLQEQDFRTQSGALWQIDWTTWEHNLRLDRQFGLYSATNRLQSGRNIDRMPSLESGWAEIEVDWPSGTPPTQPVDYFGPMVGMRKEIAREQNLEVIPIGMGGGNVDLVLEAWDGNGPVILARWPMPKNAAGTAIPSPGDIIRARWQQVGARTLEVRASYFDASTSTWLTDVIAGTWDLSNINGVNFFDGFHLASSLTSDSIYYSIRRYQVGTIDTYPSGSSTACSPTVSPLAASAAAGGGTASVGVTAASGCSWTSTSNASWLTVTSGATGSGNGSVGYSVAPNPAGTVRVGTLTVAQQTVVVTQDAAACSFVVLPASQTLASTGGAGALTVTATTGCAWSAVSNASWISVTSGATGTGNGSVGFLASANAASTSRTGTLTVAGQTVSVTEDPAPLVPSIAIGNVSVAEGNTGSTAAAFIVSLSAATTVPVTVNYVTSNGTAVAGADYIAASGVITFPPGSTSQQVAVSVVGDTLYEPNEAFAVTLSGATNAVIAAGQGVGTILNDDPVPVLAIGNQSVTEGNTGSTQAVFTVSLSAPSAVTTSVRYDTFAGTATAGSDYTAVTGTLTFAPGVTSQTIAVPVLGDTVLEANETFFVVLSAAVNASLGVAQGTGTIVNDDPLPQLSISGGSAVEGQSGQTPLVFTVQLSVASELPAAVSFATSDGTATAGSDYTATAGTLTFAPGSTTQTVSVPVLGDTVVEGDETLVVTLSSPSGATILTAQATGTIVDDDATVVVPTTSSSPVTVTARIASGPDDVNEDGATWTPDAIGAWIGTASSATGSYTGLRFSGVAVPPGATIQSARVEVNAATTSWIGLAFDIGLDAAGNSPAFSAASRPSQRTLLPARVQHRSDERWVAGTWYPLNDMAPLVQALVNQPAWASGNALSVILHGTGSTWGRKFAQAYESDPTLAARLVITYTSAAVPLPQLSIDGTSVTEGLSGSTPATFVVHLSAPSALPVTVSFATSDGTATAASGDYSATSGTLSFAPGQTTQQLAVPVLGDALVEGNETFAVTLSGAVNATIVGATATGTILDDDVAVTPPPVSLPVTVSTSIAAAADDVNEDGTTWTPDSSSVWLGNGRSSTGSYAGLRFTGVSVPPGATILSARLEVNAASTGWIAVAYEIGVEASGNAPAFTTASRPSQRTLLPPRIQHRSNERWVAGTWYPLDEMAPVVQALVNQPAWTSGNSVALVLTGNGAAWGRKFVEAFEDSPARATRLVITYQLP